MPYKKATPWKQVGEVVLTNVGQEVELPERTIGDEPNPEYSKRRNASSRIWLKNGQAVRILVEIDGIVDKANPLAVGTTSCKATERQSFYVRFRQESPQANAPTDPALAVNP